MDLIRGHEGADTDLMFQFCLPKVYIYLECVRSNLMPSNLCYHIQTVYSLWLTINSRNKSECEQTVTF